MTEAGQRLLVAVVLGLSLAAVGDPAAARHAAARCAPSPPARLGTAHHSSQVITVIAATSGATTATVRLFERTGGLGCMHLVGGPWTAHVGRSGLSAHHREGDGTTPIGVYGFEAALYGNAPNPGTHYAYHRLSCGDWWDEDPSSRSYNTFQHVPCGQRPSFGGASEALWQATIAYRYFAVLAYNDNPAIPGKGSAMFVHLDKGHPTNGCVSLGPTALKRILRWLDPAAKPLIDIDTQGGYDRG